MNKDQFVQRTLQAGANGYKYSFAEMFEQRAHQPLATRLAKVCFGKTVNSLISRSLSIDGENYSLLSAGGEQLVYANAKKISKIVFRSLSFEEGKTANLTDAYVDEYEKSRPYVREHLVDTSFEVRRLKAGLFAAIALQPRLYAQKEFLDVEELVMYEGGPDYTEELRRFFESLTSLYQNTGYQLDLNGPKNIFLDEQNGKPTIKVVDSLVVNPALQERVSPLTNLTTGEAITRKMALIGQVAA